jgi:hypothetical protein
VVSGFIVSGSDSQPMRSGWSVGEGTGPVDAAADGEASSDAEAASDATAVAEAAAEGADDAAADGDEVSVDEPQDAATSATANARDQVERQRFTATPPTRAQGMLPAGRARLKCRLCI